MTASALPPPTRPRLRHVQAHELDTPEGPLVALVDPAAPDERSLILSQAAVALVSMFDGERDAKDLQAAFLRRYGELVPGETIIALVAKLDGVGLLDSPRFEAIRQAERLAFRALPERPMTLAGECFPAEPAEALALLDSFFTAARGPGRLPGRGKDLGPGRAVPGIIAPHIDFQRGAAVYAQAYLPLIEAAGEAELFVIFGTDHKAGLEVTLSLTALDYQTPFGRLRTDKDLVAALVAQEPGLLDGELGHKQEHSIEFQAVLLHHLLGARADAARLLPVLCGPLQGPDEAFDGPEVQARIAQVQDFCSRLLEQLGERRVCFIAGADLAHLGPAFGTEPRRAADHAALEARDRLTLELLTRPDAGAFWRDAQGEGNPRNLCGSSAIYCLLRCLGDSRVEGELLAYEQCPVPGEESGASRVSICAMTYHPKG